MTACSNCVQSFDAYTFVCRVWDLQSGECKNTFKGHTNAVSSVAISPDGKTIAFGSYDKTVR